ncbi:MAG: hypothetical protein KC561_20370, partial [Myxococcales bacterium]|nr:hypothetical protein [Myxococcales bacterium]
ELAEALVSINELEQARELLTAVIETSDPSHDAYRLATVTLASLETPASMPVNAAKRLSFRQSAVMFFGSFLRI